jgi:hypothetical protein
MLSLARPSDTLGRAGACYSVFKLFIGFANAAFMAWKLTVINVISIAPIAVTINIHQATSV